MEPVSRSDQYKRVMKPLLERKRRARINRCLDELRDLLVTVLQSEGEAVTRLEKADILELTVRHVRRLSQIRRLALPSPGAKQQQDREDVAKFQQGFVAAAHQVQNFLLTTPLEPSVSSRLLSHLTNYATSITPPSPVSPSANSPQLHPPAPSLPSRPQPHHPHQPPQPSPPHNTFHPPAPPSVSPNQAPPRLPMSAPQQVPIHSTSQSATPQPLPLVDRSNQQCSPPPPSSECQRFSSHPIVRDVRCEDRTVAPSPFIDVVSTPEGEDIKPFDQKAPKQNLIQSLTSSLGMDNITLHLQAKVLGSPQYPARNSTRHHPYPLPKKLLAASQSRNCSSPVPEDLSMKRNLDTDDNKNSWRPW